MNTLRLTLNPLEKKSHINPEIYGNFSEHLGRCIYDGIYVGENSDIPNTEGFRTDVIDAYRQIKTTTGQSMPAPLNMMANAI